MSGAPSEQTLRRVRDQLRHNGIKTVADVRRLLESWPTVNQRLTLARDHPHRGLGEQARALFLRALQEGTTAEWFSLAENETAADRTIEKLSSPPPTPAFSALIEPLQALLNLVQSVGALAAERDEFRRVFGECQSLRDELRQRLADPQEAIAGEWLKSQADNLRAEMEDLDDSVERRLERFDAALLQVRLRLDRLEYGQLPLGPPPAPPARRQLVVDGEVVD